MNWLIYAIVPSIASVVLGLILLLLFYAIRRKIGFSLGVWNYSIAMLIAGFVIVPNVFILGEKFLSFSVVLGLLFAILTFVVDKNLEKKEKLKTQYLKSKFQFYYACVKNGVTSLDKEKDIKRAELIAKDYPVAYGLDIKEFFEECKALVENAENLKKENTANQELQALRNKEQAEYNSRMRYANCKGNEKTILNLTQELDQLINGYRQDSSFGKRASEHLLEREKDWAVRGGMASAIAGPVAGLAVAIDTQEKNAAIRERNNAKSAAITQMQMFSNSRAREKEELIKKTRERIATEKLKLTQELSDEIAREYLDITVDQVEFSKTGAFRINAIAKMIKPLIIFEDVHARIDGSLTCVLSQEGKIVGEAKMVLPLYGLSPEKVSQIKLTGICLSGVSEDKPYSAEFVFDNIWGIEN